MDRITRVRNAIISDQSKYAIDILEYLAITGTQWFNLKIKNSSRINFELKLQLVANYARVQNANLFGDRTSATEANNTVIHSYYGLFNLDYGDYLINRLDPDNITAGGNPYLVGRNGVNAYGVNESTTFQPMEFETDRDMYLGNVNGNVWTTTLWRGRIFYCDVADDILSRYLIPVRIRSTGVVCFLDELSGEFFFNQGTGECVAGPVISYR